MASFRSERVVALFAGIGGLEYGLHRRNWSTELFCEIDPGAQAVLAQHFQDARIAADVRQITSLPADTAMVTAGFPCQDLSQAGRTLGISGGRSGLVDQVFRLLEQPRGSPRWLLLENVPFMLQLDRGRAMRHLTEALGERGFRWAYRVVDARAFGLPQRRWRVLLLASRVADPRQVLFGDDAVEPAGAEPDDYACGFYWTEGTRGLGWAVDAVPTLKGGSAVGIASPPAVRLTAGRGVVTPGIADAERLQGFDAGWTRPALDAPGVRSGHRWKLVGNAVSTRMSTWIADRLAAPVDYDGARDAPMRPDSPWPVAGWGELGVMRRTRVGRWPVEAPYEHLEQFLRQTQPLSARATAGFLRRARAGSLRFVPGFLDDVTKHLIDVGGNPSEAA